MLKEIPWNLMCVEKYKKNFKKHENFNLCIQTDNSQYISHQIEKFHADSMKIDLSWCQVENKLQIIPFRIKILLFEQKKSIFCSSFFQRIFWKMVAIRGEPFLRKGTSRYRVANVPRKQHHTVQQGSYIQCNGTQQYVFQLIEINWYLCSFRLYFSHVSLAN